MMKKTMIALAALAAIAGTAQAQSNVTLYGVADVYVARSTTKTTTAAGTTSFHTNEMESGGLSGSRWGMRGMEDLGGGLRATFQLESGIDISEGLSTGFNRTSKVGLAGGFGSIEFGRQYTRVFGLIDSYDAQGTSNFSATNAYFGGLNDAVRWDNSIVYATPNLGGINLSAQYAFGENATPAASAGHGMGLSAGYTGGPFSIQGAYQTVDAGGAAPTEKTAAVGMSYDLGVVKLLGQFIHQKDGVVNGVTEKFQHVSVSVPVGSMSAFNVGFGREREKTAGLTTAETDAFGVQYQYSLSKRTTMYAAIAHLKTDVVGGSFKDQQYALGMRHAF